MGRREGVLIEAAARRPWAKTDNSLFRTGRREQLTSGWGSSPGPEVNQRWRMSESCLPAVSLGCSGPIWQKGKDMPNAVSAWSGGNTGWWQCQSPLSLSVLTCDFRTQAPASYTGRWPQAGLGFSRNALSDGKTSGCLYTG